MGDKKKRQLRTLRGLTADEFQHPADVAACPACGGEVRKRKRKNGRAYTYFYRHRIAAGEDCPLRYHPTS